MRRRNRKKQTGYGTVAVVTGASAGVGRALSRILAHKGYDVALLARGKAGLDAAAREVQLSGCRSLPLSVDVSQHEEVQHAASRIEFELGPIDVWINNAMVTALVPFDKLHIDEFRRITEVTYLGTVHGTVAALQRMSSRDRGHIMQVGSALAYRGIPLQSAYCGAKHAIRGFTDSLRTELLHEKSNIIITMAQLPGMNTPQFQWCLTCLRHHPQPVPPIYQPEVAAEAIVDSIGYRKRELWVSATTWKVILGNKLFPRIADHYLAQTGYEGQQSHTLDFDADRQNNLFEPKDDQTDVGAYGPFNAIAKTQSIQAKLSSTMLGKTLQRSTSDEDTKSD